MGRNRSRDNPDRFLVRRDNHYHYKRRMPKELADLDERAPHVRQSLKTGDRASAGRPSKRHNGGR